ncbi:MAG: hypothetical protein WDW38_010903 [Sanguina aurantia]
MTSTRTSRRPPPSKGAKSSVRSLNAAVGQAMGAIGRALGLKAESSAAVIQAPSVQRLGYPGGGPPGTFSQDGFIILASNYISPDIFSGDVVYIKSQATGHFCRSGSKKESYVMICDVLSTGPEVAFRVTSADDKDDLDPPSSRRSNSDSSDSDNDADDKDCDKKSKKDKKDKKSDASPKTTTTTTKTTTVTTVITSPGEDEESGSGSSSRRLLRAGAGRVATKEGGADNYPYGPGGGGGGGGYGPDFEPTDIEVYIQAVDDEDRYCEADTDIFVDAPLRCLQRHRDAGKHHRRSKSHSRIVLRVGPQFY